MATLYSVQSGSWSDEMTWMGGDIPNLANDDVIIDAGHTVNIEESDLLSLFTDRTITVMGGATLSIRGQLITEAGSTLAIAGALVAQAGCLLSMCGTLTIENNAVLMCYGSVYVDSTSNDIDGLITVEFDGRFSVQNNAVLTINGGLAVTGDGTLSVSSWSQLYLQSGCAVSFLGCLTVSDGSYLYVLDELFLESGSVTTLADGGCLGSDCSGTIRISGYVSLDSGGVLAADCDGWLIIERDGTVVVNSSATVRGWCGHIDVFGQMTCSIDSYIDVGEATVLNVWREIVSDGSIYVTGQIVMLRREACIRNSSGLAKISAEQTYGYRQR